MSISATFIDLLCNSLQDSSGSIRSAGGAFGKKEKAVEDQYFHNLVSIYNYTSLAHLLNPGFSLKGH